MSICNCPGGIILGMLLPFHVAVTWKGKNTDGLVAEGKSRHGGTWKVRPAREDM